MNASAPAMVLVDGKPGGEIDPRDRGLQYGDGVFETIRIQQGQPLFWAAHLERLRLGCDRLGFMFPGVESLVSDLRALLMSAESRCVVKFVVTRGVGGRGYNPAGCVTPTRIALRYPWPSYPDDYQNVGVRLRLCRMRLGLNPELAGIKHLNRLEQVLARSEWGDDYQEGLLLDASGHIAEGTMSNIFFVRHGRLLTPGLATCGVRGILRAAVLREACALGVEVEEGDYPLEHLMQAEAAFLSNVVVGLWPVRAFEGQTWAPHPLCAMLRTRLGLDG